MTDRNLLTDQAAHWPAAKHAVNFQHGITMVTTKVDDRQRDLLPGQSVYANFFLPTICQIRNESISSLFLSRLNSDFSEHSKPFFCGLVWMCRGFQIENVTHSRYTHSLSTISVDAMKKRRSTLGICERFGYAVKIRREELALTQEDLADKASIHRTYLSDVERGTRNVSLINIERIASALSLPVSELFRQVEKS